MASREEKGELLYFELDGVDFSLNEIRQLKEKLPEEVRNGIEKLARPLFMPRNEEEVMRNIVVLSDQLKSARDIPQVHINFDEQTTEWLQFTVICLRVLREGDSALRALFEKSGMQFIPDRVKQVGVVRKKYPKEATVFKVQLLPQPFLRTDHSVDLYKARLAIVKELQRILGDFRDFNGGMIAKQQEQFFALKSMMGELAVKEDLLLENFFHSIFPIELRSLFPPLPLKNLFTLLRVAMQRKEAVLSQCDAEYCYFLLSYNDLRFKERALEFVRSVQTPSSQFLTLSLQAAEVHYFGVIYREADAKKREIFLNRVCNLDF